MKKKIKILVLCGGESPEFEVSLLSGKTCAINFPDKYLVKPAVILKNGKWIFGEKYFSFEEKDKISAWFEEIILSCSNKTNNTSEDRAIPIYNAVEEMHLNRPDLIYLTLHGPRGEDGTIQGLFEFLRIPYTGANVLASSLGMDKHRFQKLLDYHGIKIPRHVILFEFEKLTEEIISEVERKIGYPCFVKPSRCGSSVGMGIANNSKELMELIKNAREYDLEVLIEEYIKGTELTCGIINRIGKNGEDEVLVLQPTEIIPKKSVFFDYKSKYTAGESEEITPARLSPEKIKEVQKLTEHVFRLCGAKGFSRVDMILKDNILYTLEINTIPGMTPTSLLPQGAKACGLSLPELLDEITAYTLKFCC